jgi:hypothetical protein
VSSGSKICPSELLDSLQSYSKQKTMQAPSIMSICKDTGLARNQVEHIVSALSTVEAEAAKEANGALQLAGDLEGDCCAVRKTYVGSANPHFQAEIMAARERWLAAQKKVTSAVRQKAKKLVWMLHVRVIGICQRGGNMAMQMLPYKLCPKGGRPVIESTQEIIDSKLLQDNVKARGKHTLHTDGCWSWPAARKKLGLKNMTSKRCNHSMRQYAHAVEDVPKSLSKITGTMSVDARWNSLQKFMPDGMKTRQTRQVNGDIEKRSWQWLWRHNMPDRSKLLEELGRACGLHRMK